MTCYRKGIGLLTMHHLRSIIHAGSWGRLSFIHHLFIYLACLYRNVQAESIVLDVSQCAHNPPTAFTQLVQICCNSMAAIETVYMPAHSILNVLTSLVDGFSPPTTKAFLTAVASLPPSTRSRMGIGSSQPY